MDETPLLHLQSEKSIWMDKNGDAGTMSGVTTEETVSFNLPPVYFTYLNYKTEELYGPALQKALRATDLYIHIYVTIYTHISYFRYLTDK